MSLAEDFGNVRVYRCCGGHCVRPLTGTPEPCERCGGSLIGEPCKVQPHHEAVERITEEIYRRHRHL